MNTAPTPRAEQSPPMTPPPSQGAAAPPPGYYPPQNAVPYPQNPNQPYYGAQGAPGAVPPYGAPPAVGMQGGYGMQPQPPKKKNKAVLPVILIAVGAVVLIAVLAIVAWLQSRPSAEELEYNTLQQNICASTTPEQVAAYSDRLETFEQQNPDLVQPDLKSLVSKCVEYVDAEENDRKYLNMTAALQVLSGSSVEGVPQCAQTLMGVVSAADEAFQAEAHTAESQAMEQQQALDDAAGGEDAPDNLDGYPLQPDYMDYEIDVDEAGDATFAFTVSNTTDKTIVLYEAWVFCYDAQGNRITGADGTSIEWAYDSSTIAPGETLPKEDGYWNFFNCENVAIIVPYISYIEYSDGSEWGNADGTLTESQLNQMLETVGLEMDIYAMLISIGNTAVIDGPQPFVQPVDAMAHKPGMG